MKKSITLLALALVAITANAGGLSAFSTYDYDRTTDGSVPYKSQHEVHVGGALTTVYGTFDAAVVGRELVSSFRDGNNGFEVGYSNGLKYGPVALTGRLAYGQADKVDTTVGGFGGNTEYYSLGAEASTKVVGPYSAFAGLRYRHNLNSETPAQYRYTVGGEYAVAPNVAVRLGYAYTKQAGYALSGATTGIVVKF